MGAIQGSINSMLGTAAAGAAAGKHLAQQAASIKSAETAELAKLDETVPAMKEEKVAGAEEIKAKKEDIAGFEMKEVKGAEKLLAESDDEGYAGAEENLQNVNKDLEMRKLALKTLQGKQKARVAVLKASMQRQSELRKKWGSE